MDLHPAVRIQEYVLHELLPHLFRHLRDFEKRLYRLDLLSRLIVRILCQLFRHARIGYLLLQLCDFRIITPLPLFECLPVNAPVSQFLEEYLLCLPVFSHPLRVMMKCQTERRNCLALSFGKSNRSSLHIVPPLGCI